MTRDQATPTTRQLPTRKDAIVFRAKSALLQAKRLATNAGSGRVRRHAVGVELNGQPVLARSVTPLWTETDPAERFLVAGKIHNLRLAVRELNGVEISGGEIFSFWKQVGRAGRMRGYVRGRELREGCIVPNVGGGLCQLSNALYDAALAAGFEIVERHAHSQVIPGSLAEKGRDATVFWNYVDLRFKSDRPFRIDAVLDSENLVVSFQGQKPAAKTLHKISRSIVHTDGPNSCATCGMDDCHRVVDAREHLDFGRTAYLLDEFSPEFDEYIKADRTEADELMIPLDGRRFRKANYAWSTNGFSNVRQSVFVTAKRSYRSRKLAAQGAARQRNLLRMYEELAASYAKRLRFDVLHVVVQQNLLPYLWRAGHLGGRTFDVLMTALPMEMLQHELDRARTLHPESPTLGDFRADLKLIRAETEALKNANKIVTPHTAIAEKFPGRAVLLDWKMPTAKMSKTIRSDRRPVVVFPAATVGRKGCYELREAIRGLDVKLTLLGPVIETKDFWDGFDVESGEADWIEGADLVVLPAFVEHRPRRLLAAAAKGVPVIASMACGVSNIEGIELIAAGDTYALREKMVKVLGSVENHHAHRSKNILVPASN